jgi:hypothetical protein
MKLFNWRTALMLLICATLTFGGSFTCFATTNGDGDGPSTRGN